MKTVVRIWVAANFDVDKFEERRAPWWKRVCGKEKVSVKTGIDRTHIEVSKIEEVHSLPPLLSRLKVGARINDEDILLDFIVLRKIPSSETGIWTLVCIPDSGLTRKELEKCIDANRIGRAGNPYPREAIRELWTAVHDKRMTGFDWLCTERFVPLK